MTTTRPRVFVSHSAKTSAERAFLDALLDALTDYPVVVDRDALELGTAWRSTLNVWIGGCDVAIVLLSESALRSKFVAYEASILAYRHAFDPAFTLLPVFLDGVDYHAVQTSLLEPSRIHDVFGALTDLEPAEAIERLLAKLEALAPVATPLDAVVQLVVDRLANVQEHYLETCIARLGGDLAPWLPGAELRKHAAATMLAAGLERAAPSIRPFRSLVAGPDLTDLIELLACSWVDYRAIRDLPQAASTCRPIGVNADEPLVARMYVIRAGVDEQRLLPRDRWLIVELDGVQGTDADQLAPPVEVLRAQLSERLAAEFNVEAESLAEELEASASDGEHVFAAIPAVGNTHAVLEALQSEFRSVTFFVLTGSAGPVPSELEATGVLVLRPQLEPGVEAGFRSGYKSSTKSLNRRLRGAAT